MFNEKLCARKWSWPNLGTMPMVICRDWQQKSSQSRQKLCVCRALEGAPAECKTRTLPPQ